MPEVFYPVESFGGIQKEALRFEADVYECDVVGEIPPELQGSLYRAGPDRTYPSLEGDVIINGDGIVSRFHFDNGHVRFKCRYVKTERYLKEQEASCRLYGKYRNKYSDDESTVGTDRDNTGNTYAFFHHGRLFALREDSWPHEIDPDSLETLPRWNFNGELKSSSLTAHPKIDPITGEWWSFSLFAHGAPNCEMMLHVIDRSGKLYRQEEFLTPYPGISHDFAVTREHVIFAIMPLTTDNERIEAGGDFYAYDDSLPSCWGIMPRDGSTEDIRWFKVPDCFSGHIMNAYTEGNKVHVDATISPGNAFPFFSDVDGNATDPQKGNAILTRLTFDLSVTDKDSVTQSAFPDAMGEMPRIDDRYAMEKYRYGYMTLRGPIMGIGRVDMETGKLDSHVIEDSSAQEPIFVPRHADSPEGDGFILCLVNRFKENRADLLILDAQKMDSPPLATIKLPFNQPIAFHGGFVPS